MAAISQCVGATDLSTTTALEGEREELLQSTSCSQCFVFCIGAQHDNWIVGHRKSGRWCDTQQRIIFHVGDTTQTLWWHQLKVGDTQRAMSPSLSGQGTCWGSSKEGSGLSFLRVGCVIDKTHGLTPNVIACQNDIRAAVSPSKGHEALPGANRSIQGVEYQVLLPQCRKDGQHCLLL